MATKTGQMKFEKCQHGGAGIFLLVFFACFSSLFLLASYLGWLDGTIKFDKPGWQLAATLKPGTYRIRISGINYIETADSKGGLISVCPDGYTPSLGRIGRYLEKKDRDQLPLPDAPPMAVIIKLSSKQQPIAYTRDMRLTVSSEEKLFLAINVPQRNARNFVNVEGGVEVVANRDGAGTFRNILGARRQLSETNCSPARVESEAAASSQQFPLSAKDGKSQKSSANLAASPVKSGVVLQESPAPSAPPRQYESEPRSRDDRDSLVAADKAREAVLAKVEARVAEIVDRTPNDKPYLVDYLRGRQVVIVFQHGAIETAARVAKRLQSFEAHVTFSLDQLQQPSCPTANVCFSQDHYETARAVQSALVGSIEVKTRSDKGFNGIVVNVGG